MARQHPRTIAYLRVSTSEQDVAKNQTEILLLAHRKQLGQVQFVEETVSSRVPWRRRMIAQVLDTLEAGDTLVVSELSRLGVTDCNRNGSGLQSARFWDHIHCLYRRAQDRIICL
jgi:DNA invertase Pin-like site-specific DNA recombinase